MLETHISWVLLTGLYAYKIKKPVCLGFVDFASLEKRRFYCEEELRLNRRYAPDLYLAVVPITGSVEHPSLNGTGEPIEYAVKMREFSQCALLSELSARGQLQAHHIDQLVMEITRFHERAARAGASTPYGSPDTVHHWVDQNFAHIRPLLTERTHIEWLEQVRSWSEREWNQRQNEIQARKAGGFVRECHGDMHLGNMALIDACVTIFDCIEFNPDLRWIDVMSEVAFAVMDLCDRGHREFAYRFLNTYLQRTGDYGGISVLRYYLAYRAMVRAKVAVLRLAQGNLTEPEKAEIWQLYGGYLDLAVSYSKHQWCALIITHGLSGSGKSTVAGQLVESLGAIQIGSDVERKRLFGYQAEARTGSALRAGLYTDDVTQLTYDRLAELAKIVIESGYPAIIDATFLKRSQRARFRGQAAQLEVPFVVLDFQAADNLLRHRVAFRGQQQADPSEAGLNVLEAQLRTREPLSAEELAYSLTVYTTVGPSLDRLTNAIFKMLSQPETE